MKFLLIIICSTISLLSISQVTPPELNFNNMTEKWKYIYSDPNLSVLADDPTASAYSHRVPVKYLIDNNSIYLLEAKVSPNPYNGVEGSILHNIDLTTGLSKWVDYNTSFLDLDYRIDITNGELYLDDNSITMTGYRDLEPINYTFPKFAFYGTPMYRSVDINTGELKEEKYGANTPSGLFYTVTGPDTKIIRTDGNRYSSISADLTIDNGTVNNSYKFHQLSEGLDYTYPITDSIGYDSGLPTTETSLSYPSTFGLYDEYTMLCLFGTKNPADFTQSPAELYLNWYDISNLNNVPELRSVDVVGDVYYPQDLFSTIKLKNKDENVILYQEMFFPTNSPEPNNEFVWLSWYDMEGNRIAHLDPIHILDRYYPAITVLGVKDGSLYIAGGYRENLTEGYDILKIEPGENNYTKVGELSIPTSNTINYGISQAQILPNGDLFIAVGLEYEPNSTRHTFHYYYRFDGSTLGILTDTKDEQLSDLQLQVYPNPATENIRFTLNDQFTGKMKIVNNIGQEVYTSNVDHMVEYQLDVSDFSAGMYTAVFTDDTSNEILKTKFIVVE